MNNNDRRWLLIRHGAIGDTILLSPLVQAIRKNESGGAWIELAGNEERLALLKGERLADRVRSTERLNFSCLYDKSAPIPDELKCFFTQFDIIVMYSNIAEPKNLKSRICSRNDQIVRIWPALPNEHHPRMHIIDFYAKAVEDILPANEMPLPFIELSDEEISRAKSQLIGNGVDLSSFFVLALHPGAGSESKRAPIHRFVEIVEYFQQRWPVFLLLSEGPADGDAVGALMYELKGIPLMRLKDKPLRELAGCIQQANLFVGNDSGIAHMAAAVGCPTVVFFVCSEPDIWAPLGNHVRIVELS